MLRNLFLSVIVFLCLPVIIPAQAEGEVDLLLKKLQKDNQLVIGRCLEVSPCKSIKREVIPGQVIKGKVVEGKIDNSKQKLFYPPAAKAAQISGSVVVKVVIDEKGKVIAAQAVSGHPLLREAALNAAREIESKPTLLAGKTVKTMGSRTYTFSYGATVIR